MAIETIDPATSVDPAAPVDIAAPVVAPVRSRRALLTAALGGLGGLLASRLGSPDAASAAAGGPLVMGAANSAGTTNTSLATASTGTALLVTQTGSGTALRGSAVGPGSIAGFFTAANGPGVSGVTATTNNYGVVGQSDGAAGTGAGVRAKGINNDGISATTDNAGRFAVKASNSGAGGTAVFGTGGAGGIGVRGVSDTYYGVEGYSNSGYGVRGLSNTSHGVHGDSTSSNGVHGIASDANGVYGEAYSGQGVLGVSTFGPGVYGYSAVGSAGFFEGNLVAYYVEADDASAGVKAFRIDHPQDPAGKILMHSCVESNERKLVYDGVVTTDARGEATIELPSYFDALNTDLRYQLTALADARAWVKREVSGNRFAIATSSPNTKVCWQVTGVRQDAYSKAHPLKVEAAKTGKEKGKYLHPVEHGKPERLGVHYELRQSMRKSRTPAA